ncbi:MAG: hypothetical protein QOF41_424 [Methylobacteriaceae bacterium]|nr:hypothetical protein [Methylobacteriaceae bacterium]
MTTIRIKSVSAPVGSCDADCAPVRANTWRTDFPLADPARVGIGYAVEPSPFVFTPTMFAIHDHHYTAPNVPDAARATITYEFSTAAQVKDFLIVQHTNGIVEIEGFAADTPAAVSSAGASIGVARSRLVGSATGGNMFVEGARDIFEFPAHPARLFFRILIRKTPLANGYASYRLYPRNADHDPFTVASVETLSTHAGLITLP